MPPPCAVALLLLSAVLVWPVSAESRRAQGGDVQAVRRVVDDYIALYRQDTLPQWKTLFLPAFTASYTNDDGSVTTRALDDFYERQRAAFERGPVSERLENVRIQRAGRLAQVFADFYFKSGTAAERHGQLMLLLIEEGGGFKIAALAFTYHLVQ
jgi:hypothetical protein